MNLTQVNNSGSCEPLGDFLHLCYNYKCMCFNLNIKWRHLISITSFKLGHVSIPNKRIFLPLFFFFFYYIYITPVNNLPLGARKPQRFTDIYNEQYN